jgi:hypothetical protein
MPGPLLLVAALALPGCWSALVASVQPKGKPRLIQTFKMSRRVKLDEMETGDEVTIRPVEAIALRMKK